MAKKIDPELKKIGDYLNLGKEANFVIPEYQRAYSWEVKQCDKLWQDLENFIESGGLDPYFFGTIIVNCQENDTKLSLIDGQQRTTTFILLYKALLLRINKAIGEKKIVEDAESLEFSLKNKRNRIIKILFQSEDKFVLDFIRNFENTEKGNILENNSINELYKDDLKIILNSSSFEAAEQNVSKIKYKQKDNKYTNYFRNFKFFYNKLNELAPSQVDTFAEYVLDKSEIIEIRSWNVEQAITMFNSLNSDGMPLLDADIISAKLYSKSGVNREDFNKNWAVLKARISDLDERKVSSIDDILKEYMYIDRAINKTYISDKGSISVTVPGLRRYYTEENKKILENPIELTAELIKIAEIWKSIQSYPIISLCSKFNENIKIYIISYLYRFNVNAITESLVTDFVDSLLKLFALLELVDLGYSSSKFKTFLFGLNINLVDKNINLDEIKLEINKHINKEWKKEEIRPLILDYSKNPLVYLNEYLASKEKNKKYVYLETSEIEHIAPRSGVNIDQIRLDVKALDKEEFLEIVNKLGNKILLEASINRSIGNAWFRSKIQSSIDEKKGYKGSVFTLAENIVSSFENESDPLWTVDDINNETEKIADRIIDYIFEI